MVDLMRSGLLPGAGCRSRPEGGGVLDRPVRQAFASLAVAFALLAAPSAAQDDEGLYWVSRGNQIVVTSTRTPLKIEDVPATVTVKSNEQIADELVSDVKDLVRFEPGVSVRQSPARFGAAFGVTGRDGASSFNIRGLDGNRVLIQVDGVRVPDGFEFGAQAAGRGNYVDLGLIKSVEILRGPASALYGSDGLAGAVSFVTSDPADLLEAGETFGGRLRAGYDSADNEFTETAVLAGRSGAVSGLVAYARRDGNELKNQGANFSPNSNRTAPNPQDTGSDAFLGKLLWETGPSSRLRLTAEYFRSFVDTNVLSGVAPVPSAATSVLGLVAYDSTERARAALDWRYEGEGAIDFVQLTAYWQRGENRQFTAEDRNTAADRTRFNLFENRVIGGAADFRSNFATGGIRHQVAWGADLSVTRQTGLRDGTVPTPPDVFPTRAFPVTDFTLAGGYLTDRMEIFGGRLQLYPALRFDHFRLSPRADPLLPGFAAASQGGSRVSPKIGAVAKVGGGFSFFAAYAHGFKAPAPSQVNQFFENPTSVFGAYRTIPNPNLKPETSKAIEGGLRFAGKHLFASVSGFSGRYRNFISQETIGGTGTIADPQIFQYINLARVQIDGVEGKVEWNATSGLGAQLAVSYASGEVSRGSGRLPLASIDPLKIVAGVGYRAPSGRFGGQLIITHSRRKPLKDTVGTDDAGAPTTTCGGSPCYRPPSFTLVDLTAFAKVTQALTLRAGLFNLLDEKYTWWSDVRGLADTSAIKDAHTQPGRNVSVSLSYRF